MFKNKMNLPGLHVELTHKLATEATAPMFSLLLVFITFQLLEVFNTEELHILNLLKVDCSNTACFPSMQPIFHIISLCQLKVLKNTFIFLNVKLLVKIRFNSFMTEAVKIWTGFYITASVMNELKRFIDF